jgi:hypothetical protein
VSLRDDGEEEDEEEGSGEEERPCARWRKSALYCEAQRLARASDSASNAATSDHGRE